MPRPHSSTYFAINIAWDKVVEQLIGVLRFVLEILCDTRIMAITVEQYKVKRLLLLLKEPLNRSEISSIVSMQHASSILSSQSFPFVRSWNRISHWISNNTHSEKDHIVKQCKRTFGDLPRLVAEVKIHANTLELVVIVIN